MFEFKFPDVGEGIAEGEIVKWRVNEGDIVKEDQVIVEMETDKAVVEIPSPKSGTIAKLHHKQGDHVKVGDVLVTIAEIGEKMAEVKATSKPEAATTASKEDHYSSSVVGQLEEAPPDVITTTQVRKAAERPKETKATTQVHVSATPAVRRLARDLHVNLEAVRGTGQEGRITEEDVRNAAEGKGVTEIQPAVHISKKYDFYGYVERQPLKGVRRAVAEHMKKSIYTAPHVTHMDEADVTELWSIREKEKDAAKRKNIHLTFLPFIIKAVIAALKEHPSLNASLDDEHEEIIVKKYYNVGVAVDMEDGLIVPVIKEADRKTILDIAKEIADLADKAQSRKLDLADLKGNSFTITNIGSIGGLFATPIINWPDVAILALGKIYDKVVYKDGRIQARKYMPFSIAFDHRVLDGAECARFANVMKERLEDPEMLMLGE